MKVRMIIPVILLLATPAWSQVEVAQCAEVDGDLDRLACFDRASGRTAVTQTVPNETDWKVSVEKSEFEDTTDVFLNVSSSEVVNCGSIYRQSNVELWLRCHENTTAIYLSTSCHLTDHGSYGKVDARLDADKSFITNMDASTNNRSLGLWRGNSAIPFIKKLLGKEKLIVRFTPFSESARTATFNISGLEEVIAPLRKSCKW